MGLLGFAAAASVLGTAMNAAGQQQAGNAAQAGANFTANENDRQAAADQDAALAQAEKIRRQGRETASQARAGLAASGITVDEGSGLDIQRQITANSESDALASILTGQRQADTLRRQGQMLRQSGQASQDAAALGTASALVSGAGRIASGWQKAAKD